MSTREDKFDFVVGMLVIVGTIAVIHRGIKLGRRVVRRIKKK